MSYCCRIHIFEFKIFEPFLIKKIAFISIEIIYYPSFNKYLQLILTFGNLIKNTIVASLSEIIWPTNHY